MSTVTGCTRNNIALVDCTVSLLSNITGVSCLLFKKGFHCVELLKTLGQAPPSCTGAGHSPVVHGQSISYGKSVNNYRDFNLKHLLIYNLRYIVHVHGTP